MTGKTKIKPAKGQNLGVGRTMAALLMDGKSTEQVLAAIHKKFPGSTATRKDVSLIRGRVVRGEFDQMQTERIAKKAATRKSKSIAATKPGTRTARGSKRTRSRSRKK